MKLIINIDDEMVCNDIKNKALEPTSATDEVIIHALYNGIPYEERPTGKWEITKSLLSDETIVRCSLCGDAFIGYQTEDYKYCPICGAKMEIEK